MPPGLSSGSGIELEGAVAAGGLVRAVLAVRLVAADRAEGRRLPELPAAAGRAACVGVGAVFFGSGVAGVLEVAMDQYKYRGG